ncbi:MAG: RsmB/NOP family class I SAM-dependent RNA methyltransferase [Pseudomonadota bacterium]
MTPTARFQTAIEILDAYREGSAAEQLLTRWARASRYAGSKDRAAVRDIVFDILRRFESCAVQGGTRTGRGLVLGYCRQQGIDPASVFTGDRYGPKTLSETEESAGEETAKGSAAALDCQEWLLPRLSASLGANRDAILERLRDRAPVFLRVNLARLSREDAINELVAQGIATRTHPLSPSALEVVEGARQIRNAALYSNGFIELQDAASQAVADFVPLSEGQAMLDYCAGGGGKTLAVAGRVKAKFYLHDAVPARLKDALTRAERADVDVTLLEEHGLSSGAPFPVVLVDAPCSGSGAWRRSPEGKWRFTEQRLNELCATQSKILTDAASLVASEGALVYATCSLLAEENQEAVTAFLADHAGWQLERQQHFTPLDGADGFFAALLRKS